MIRRLLILSITALTLNFTPAFAAETEMPAIDVEQPQPQEISISVSGTTVYVTNANGLTLQVISVTGSTVATVKIDATDKKVELNLTRGCYILKVGKVVRKVSIR